MSKKRGLSLEEKREQILQIFYESQDFFLLKELEKLGPRKGVISQTVKDVVQSLVDDDLVYKDKIGTSVFFWSLPSCAGNQLRHACSKLEDELASTKKRHSELVLQKESLKKGREDSDERGAALNELKQIEEQYKALEEELERYADNDPTTVDAMRIPPWPLESRQRVKGKLYLGDSDTIPIRGWAFHLDASLGGNASGVAHEAANRWTDNIFALQQWCSANFPEAKERLEHLYKEVGITESFDYLE